MVRQSSNAVQIQMWEFEALASEWLLNIGIVVEESLVRSKWEAVRGQAVCQHETACDTKKKRHVSMETKDGRGG